MTEFFPGPEGRLESAFWMPADGSEPEICAAVAHPNPAAGGSMRTTAVFRTARGLQNAGLGVLRFNFRGVGESEGEIEAGPREVEDLRAALDELERRFPGVRLWAGGFSFGSRTAAALAGDDERIERVCLIAMPVDAFDCSPVTEVRCPGLVLQAENDQFGNLASLKREFPVLPVGLELDEIPDTDHFFVGKTRELETRVRDYALRHLERPS